jgi:Protein of unknwon function (DUF3310)
MSEKDMDALLELLPRVHECIIDMLAAQKTPSRPQSPTPGERIKMNLDKDYLGKDVVEKSNDTVNHPAHYTASPSGVECITVVEHMTFNVGNAVKYLWRAGIKAADSVEDLKKAAWYVQREIERLSKT